MPDSEKIEYLQITLKGKIMHVPCYEQKCQQKPMSKEELTQIIDDRIEELKHK